MRPLGNGNFCPLGNIACKVLLYTYIKYMRHYIYQPPCFEFDPWDTKDLRRRRRSEIMPVIPVENSHTRIKPLALASGHGRYTTVTPERELVSVGE